MENKIAKLRKEKNISQEELAEVLSTTRQAVSKWERDESYPDVDKLKDLATFFNVSIDYLLDYENNNEAVNIFVKRLQEAVKKETYDIAIDEIKKMIITNNNNFNLYVCSIYYLMASKMDSKNSYDLIIDYANKALKLYVDNFDISRNDLHRIIVVAYVLKKDYKLAKEYSAKYKVSDVDSLLINCEYGLNNIDEALTISSNLYLKSLSDLINANLMEVLVLARKNNYEEAYNLSCFILDFLKSISKEDNLFLDIVYIVKFITCALEKRLSLNYNETFNYLMEHKNDIDSNISHSKNLKYFYNDETVILSIIKDEDDNNLFDIINSFNNSELYEILNDLYSKLFTEAVD